MITKKTNRTARKKKRRVGRPRTTGMGKLIGIRCHTDFLTRVDEWQVSKAPTLSRPQAIRQLAETGLHRADAAPVPADIEIFRVSISKKQLGTIPAADRNLLLLASHAVNQISIVRKILIFSTNYQSGSTIENLLSAGQSQTILRILFGALAEAWEMIRRPVNQRLIGVDYLREIETDGVAVFNELKKHFGKSNLLHRLRNTIAYHHPSGSELDAAFKDVPEDEDWAWYPSETINNSFYLASDMVITASILRATGERDTAKAFGKIMDEVVEVSNIMTDFFLYLMRAIVSRHLGAEILSPRRGTGTKIDSAPSLYEFAIPFFTVRHATTPRREI